MSGTGTLACYSSSVVLHVCSYIIVLHVLSTPRYDAERLVWSEDIMRVDTVLM